MSTQDVAGRMRGRDGDSTAAVTPRSRGLAKSGSSEPYDEHR
jgi:hypothetical protein